VKRVALFVVIFGFIVGGYAAPVVTGGKGLARVYAAGNQGINNWTIGSSFAGPYHGAEHMNDLDINTWDNTILRVFGSWVPVKAFEVSAATGVTYSYRQAVSGRLPYIGPADIELTGKYSIPLEFWKVGALGKLYIPLQPLGYSSASLGGELRLLGSTDFDIFSVHLNIGGFMRDTLALLLATGVEARYGIFNPYLELTSELTTSSAAIRLTPGLRVFTDLGINFFLASDFGLTPTAQSVALDGSRYVNQVSFGLAYSPSLEVTVHKRSALFNIKVEDAVTGLPIPAKIVISDHYPGVFVLGSTGQRVLEVESGRYDVTVSAPGYVPQSLKVNFSSSRLTSLKVNLRPDVEGEAQLNLRIYDKNTGKVIPQASVNIAGSALVTNNNGELFLTLPSGSYTMDVAASGYIVQKEAVTLSTAAPVSMDIALLPSASSLILTGVNFESGSAIILPQSYPALEQAVRFLNNNPGVIVEIQGHTDSQGSAAGNLALSQQRADAVRNYLIGIDGIDASRLIAKGYGETMPIASNATAEGRAVNRRVELVIIR